ncbi:MAG: ribonuclease HI [Peptococcaceae bacterium]|nr:ribonuclease HI [Peptococcaceae bacterium]
MDISDQSEHRVKIYTDGACSGNPGPGGWAAVLFWRDAKKEISGFVEETTNQRMELMAAIRGLEALKKPCAVDLFSDSAYLINAFHKRWLVSWQRNGWVNSKKEPVANQDLWALLLELADTHEIVWHKVRGHSDNVYNNRCDELARAEILRAKG